MAGDFRLILSLLVIFTVCFMNVELSTAGKCDSEYSCGSLTTWCNDRSNAYQSRDCTVELEDALRNCPSRWTQEQYDNIPQSYCCENDTHVRIARCRVPGKDRKCMSVTRPKHIPTCPPETSLKSTTTTHDASFPSTSALYSSKLPNVFSSQKSPVLPELPSTSTKLSTSIPELYLQKWLTSPKFPSTSTPAEFGISTPNLANQGQLRHGQSTGSDFKKGIIVGVCICIAAMTVVISMFYCMKKRKTRSDSEIYAEIGDIRRPPYLYKGNLNREYTALKRPHSGDTESAEYIDPEKNTQPPIFLINLEDSNTDDDRVGSEHPPEYLVLEHVEESTGDSQKNSHEDRASIDTSNTSTTIECRSGSSSSFHDDKSDDHIDIGSSKYRILEDDIDPENLSDDTETERSYFIMEKITVESDEDIVEDHAGLDVPGTSTTTEDGSMSTKISSGFLNGNSEDYVDVHDLSYCKHNDRENCQQGVDYPYALPVKPTKPLESLPEDIDGVDVDVKVGVDVELPKVSLI